MEKRVFVDLRVYIRVECTGKHVVHLHNILQVNCYRDIQIAASASNGQQIFFVLVLFPGHARAPETHIGVSLELNL